MVRIFSAFTLALALAACTPPSQDPPDPGVEADPAEEPVGEPQEPEAPAEDPPAEDPSAEDPPSEDPPTDDPSAGDSEPPAAAVTLPSCDGLLGPEDFEHYLFEDTSSVELLPPPPNWGPPAMHVSDAAVQSVLEQAVAIESCTWGVPQSDAFFTVVMAAVDPEGADQARSALEAAGAPTVQPPLDGFVTEQPDAMAVAVHRIEDDAIFSFQGGMGSINADDAQRHGFASLLQTASEAATR